MPSRPILLFLLSLTAVSLDLESPASSTDDQFVFAEPDYGHGFRDANGREKRSANIDPAARTLVLISAGQSNWASIAPTLYLPKNYMSIDNANIYDGELYAVSGPLLGCQYAPQFGPGHILAELADQVISGKKFDRVILVPTAIGNTSAAQWGDPEGILYTRVGLTMRRLASRGISPSTPGVTFALIFGQGETDHEVPQERYAKSLNSFIAQTFATGFVGRIFIMQETRAAGTISDSLRAAQASTWNGKTVFSGGDMDTLGAPYRHPDGTHINDAGRAAVAALVYSAMVKSGAPY